MLKTRVITAIIVAPLALAALLLLEPTPFRAFIAIVLGVCAWEWANFAYLQQPGRIGFAVAVGLLTFFAPPDVNWLWIGLGLWSFTALLVLRFPKFPLILKRPAINLLIGVVMLVPAGVALNILNSQAAYPDYLVLLLGLVWCADIGAYFAGRRFGRTKLHPAVSPGKSWAGVYGGLLVTLVFSGVWLSQVIGIGGFVADGRFVMDSLCHRYGVREYSGRSFALYVQASAGCQRLESIISRAWRFS